MKKTTKFTRIFDVLLTFLLIAGMTYGFMSLIYWNPDLSEWGGFGRFLLGAEGVIFLIKILDEL